GPEVHKLAVLGKDRGIQVERIHRDRRSGEALDRGAVLLVHVPQAVADHLVGDRVDAFRALSMQLEPGRDGKLLRRHVASVPAVEDGVLHFGDFHACFPKVISKLPYASTLSERPGCTTTVVSVVSMTAGPLTAFPGTRKAPSRIGVATGFFRSAQ